MPQHDYVIDNGSGAVVRGDINDALAAIVANNSGASEPTTTYARQWWADTTLNVLKIRNAANSAWITLPFSITTSNTMVGAIINADTNTITNIENANIKAGAGIETTKLGSGAIIQIVNTQSVAKLTGTTILPFDDTLPQDTEGIEFMTRAITPTNSSNILRILFL